MPTITDKEFGTITVRKVSNARSMRASIAPNGSLRISAPSYAPLFMVKRMLNTMRSDIRTLMETRPKITIANGLAIGKSHTMIVRYASAESVRTNGLQLLVSTPQTEAPYSPGLINEVHDATLKILRKEAKAHLPRRLRHLANVHGFTYSSVRFTHASSRWGSCNSKQAISLNIALMNLPFELIDYVLVHELAHTLHMDHSQQFWAQVETADPNYRVHRKQLKQHNPAI